MKKQYDVVILGSGPAGYMAATYVARAAMDVRRWLEGQQIEKSDLGQETVATVI